MDKLMDWWLNNCKKVLPVLLVLLCVSFYGISKLQMVYDFEAFFPKGDPDLAFYQKYKASFGPDDNNLFIAIEAPDGIFQQPFLQQLDTLTNKLDSVAGITNVLAINRVKNPIKTPFGFYMRQVLHIDKPEQYAADSARIFNDERLLGRLVSADAKAAVIVLQMQDTLTQTDANQLNRELGSLLGQFFPQRWHLAGKATIQAEYVRVQQQEVLLFTALSGFLVLLILWLIYRNWWLIAVALGTVFIALIYFLGLLGLLGIPLDLMSALFPILMLIVGLSDVIHIIARYQECIAEEPGQQHLAMKRAVKDISLAVFLTSFTTAIGFLSLVTSRIGPLQTFGFTAAMGVMVAYATAIAVVPTLLMLLHPSKVAANVSLSFLDAVVQWCYQTGKNHSNRILAASAVFLLVGLYGISQISTEARLQNDLPKREQLKADFMFFEEKLGGFRSFELALMPQGGKTIHHPEVLAAINQIETYLSGRKEVRALLSPTTLYKSLNRAHHADRAAHYTLPADEATFANYRKLIDDNPNELSKVLINQDATLGRLGGRVNDLGSDSTTRLYQNLRNWVSNNIPANTLKVQVTGSSLLYDNNNIYLVSGLLQGIGIAFVIISIFMALLFRSWRMVLASLVPNVLPLVLTGAFMGFAGIVLDAPTTIVFTIAFGIAVDDTIHFLSRYKVELSHGYGKEEALARSFQITGKALILTTVVLFFGFAVLLGSQMMLTIKVGILVSTTLATALVGDLLLLPVLLRRFTK
jgi:uncharacterized protein